MNVCRMHNTVGCIYCIVPIVIPVGLTTELVFVPA